LLVVSRAEVSANIQWRFETRQSGTAIDAPQLQRNKNSMSTKLYVGNLSFDTTEIELQDMFAEAGSVTEAALVQDKFTGRSRGFAFVTMSSAEEAQKAISLFSGKSVQGRPLTVNEARPREDFTGGGGARRSFGGGESAGGGRGKRY
jgi:cold-inducible RNA-binding protein